MGINGSHVTWHHGGHPGVEHQGLSSSPTLPVLWCIRHKTNLDGSWPKPPVTAKETTDTEETPPRGL